MSQKHGKSSFLCIELLKSFSKKELQKFDQFINSPYFNTDLKLVRLFNVIENKVLKTEFSDQLQSEVYQFVFEKTKNSTLSKDEKKTLRAKLSKLNQLAHQFLVVEQLNNNQINFNDNLYKSLLEKRQFSSFLTLSNREKKKLISKARKDINDFEYQYKIENHYLDYLLLSGRLTGYKEINITSVMLNFDVFYLQKKISYYATTVSYENKSLFQYSVNKQLYFEIKSLLNLALFENQDMLQVSKTSIFFLENPNLSTYKNFIGSIEEYNKKIPIVDLKSFYGMILNYIIVELKKGNLDFEADLVNLYLTLDKKDLLLDGGFMQTIKLKNIITRLCKVKRYDKANYFVEKYLPYVRKEDRASVNGYCLASIAYSQKEYDKALEHLLKVEEINVTLETNYRLLMMKIYYEQDKNYSERTERYYRSAEKFFIDNKLLSNENKNSYKNFTHILINLYRIKHNEGKMTTEKLAKKLESQDYNIDKKWLLEKIEELKINA